MESNNDLLFDIFMTILVVSTLLGLATWGLIFVLSFYFRTLNKSLLTSPYFNEAEQKNHKEFPLSLYKTLIYINLFSFRKMTGKRFKGASIEPPGKDIKALSYIAFSMSWLLIIIGLSMLSLILFLYGQI